MKAKVVTKIIVVAIVVTVLKTAQAFASIPVVDAANLAQSIKQVLQAIQQVILLKEQIENQVTQIEQGTKNLTNLEFSTIDDLSGNLQELFVAVGTVDGLVQDYSSLQSKFEELYPDFNQLPQFLGNDAASEQIVRWQQNNREMMKGAALTGAKVLENLPKTQAQLDALLMSSQGAVGILQATQAGNQIAGNMAGSILELSAQMATFNQANMSYMESKNSTAALQKNRMKHMTTHTPVSGRAIPLSPF